MSPLDQLIVRTASRLAVLGVPVTAEAIAEHVGLDPTIVVRRMVELRFAGQMPDAVAS